MQDLLSELKSINGKALFGLEIYGDDSSFALIERLSAALIKVVEMLEGGDDEPLLDDTPQWVVFNNRYGQTVINLSQVHAMSRTNLYSHLWFAGEQDTIPHVVYDALLDLLKPHEIASDEQEALE
jgi:hypothetical protein